MYVKDGFWRGNTVIVKVRSVPAQKVDPGPVGVTVNVATIGVVPVLTAVNAGIVFEPVVGKPMFDEAE